MENYQQKIDDLLRKARAQGAERAARTNKPFITNIVVTPKEELKSLKDIWRSMDAFDSKDTPATKFRKARKSTKGKNQKKKTKQSSSNKNYYHSNMENIPVQPFAGFSRNKRSSLLEKCNEDKTPQSTKKYTLTTDSPASDQSSDSSPLKNARKPAIANYFQRMGIKAVHSVVCSPDTVQSDTISPDTIRSDIISPDTIRSDIISPDTIRSDTENTMDLSSSFYENSSFVSISSDEDVLMASAASTPDKQSNLSDDEEMMIFSYSSQEVKTSVFKVGKNATTTRVRLPFSPKVTLDQTPEQTFDHGLTPPNRNALVGYFQKGKRQQKSSELVTGDKLNNVSPDTLRILAAAQSNGEFGLEEYKLENPFI